jgi:hypothetical protein
MSRALPQDRLAKEQRMKTESWCPQCGPYVPIDEDGCCAECGADATGPGAEGALQALENAGRTSGFSWVRVDEKGALVVKLNINDIETEHYISRRFWEAMGDKYDDELRARGVEVIDKRGRECEYYKDLAHLWEQACHDMRCERRPEDADPLSYSRAIAFAADRIISIKKSEVTDPKDMKLKVMKIAAPLPAGIPDTPEVREALAKKMRGETEDD